MYEQRWQQKKERERERWAGFPVKMGGRYKSQRGNLTLPCLSDFLFKKENFNKKLKYCNIQATAKKKK